MSDVHSALEAMNLLVVEDDALIGFSIVEMVRDQGAFVVGFCASVEAARAWLDANPNPDAAVVNLDLRGHRTDPLLDALRARGIPIVLVTGYRAEDLPSRFRTVPLLVKPFVPKELLACLAEARR